jgi:hypothetical protein
MWLIQASHSVERSSILKMETAGSSETLEPIYQTKRRYIPEYFNFIRLRSSRLRVKIVRSFRVAAIFNVKL